MYPTRSIYNLISVGSDAKTVKGVIRGFQTGILYLAPASISGVNLCPHSSPACRAACLYTAGRGAFSNVQEARIRKAKLFLTDRAGFVDLLAEDMDTLIRNSERLGLVPCARLNGTSDIPWESSKGTDGITLMQQFPALSFYDYTKSKPRMLRMLDGKLPPNYTLTFSRSERNEKDCIEILKAGGNVAAVFRKELPSEWNGFPVINGDLHDLRFSDERGVVVGLKAKGKAKYDESGFVIDLSKPVVRQAVAV
jgi:hypothetical protein